MREEGKEREKEEKREREKYNYTINKALGKILARSPIVKATTHWKGHQCGRDCAAW